jgi:hypothetical protein
LSRKLVWIIGRVWFKRNVPYKRYFKAIEHILSIKFE